MSINVFVFSKLWSMWVGDGPKEDLIKFGSKLESKVENFKNHDICWWHARTYCLNITNSKKPHNVVTMYHFFSKKDFVFIGNMKVYICT